MILWWSGRDHYFFICIIVNVVLTGCMAELLERLIIASVCLLVYKSIIYGSWTLQVPHVWFLKTLLLCDCAFINPYDELTARCCYQVLNGSQKPPCGLVSFLLKWPCFQQEHHCKLGSQREYQEFLQLSCYQMLQVTLTIWIHSWVLSTG